MSSPTELFSDSTLAKVAARRAVVLSDHGSILLQMAGFCERQNIRTFVVASQPLESSPFGYVFSRNIDERFFRKLFDKRCSGRIGHSVWIYRIALRHTMATNNTQPFRILFHPWPPYQTAVYLDGKLAMGGPGGNALNAVASSLNFTYTLATAFDYGVRLSNGSWTGMVGAVHRGEADAAMSMMALTYERHSVVLFGPCIDTIDFSMLSSSSPKQFDAFSYIRAFDVEVWAAVFGYLTCLSCLLALGGWSTPLARRRKCVSFLGSAFDHGWDLFGLLFAESSPRCYVYGSQKLLMVVWLLTVVVLANSFGSLLKSKQAVSTFKPEVDSVDDLAARPHLTPIVPSGNYYETFARHSRSLAVKKVWERSRSRGAMPRVSDLFLDSTLEQVAARRAVILADHGSILLQVTGFCERQNVRTFVVASQPLESSPFGYVFSRSIDERFFRKLFDMCARTVNL